ncbi:MAG: lectin MOA-related protein [Phycisphaerales bacterium]|nr:MAG: lectin MOA-related protein [Phycisphaerales bacterium]
MAKRKTAKKKTTRKKIVFERRWHVPSVGRPARKKYITGTQARLIVATRLGRKLALNFGMYVADGKYFCTPLSEARDIIRRSAVDRKRWVSERFDCDDFAHVLKAHFAEAAYKNGNRRASHCFGIVWGSLPGPHAINWMINSDGVLRFVEPQNDRIFLPRATDRNIYFMLV